MGFKGLQRENERVGEWPVGYQQMGGQWQRAHHRDHSGGAHKTKLLCLNKFQLWAIAISIIYFITTEASGKWVMDLMRLSFFICGKTSESKRHNIAYGLHFLFSSCKKMRKTHSVWQRDGKLFVSGVLLCTLFISILSQWERRISSRSILFNAYVRETSGFQLDI